MSINVTVSGNPVRISRGKMVTAYDPAKSEFEKRRLMRLEQVRQQSKDIAENIRNKFKNEKKKCLSQVEKDGEIKLKNWQARKLLELQSQYQEALDDIGLGHKEALRAEDEEEIYIEQQESNEKIAKERGRAAAERLQIEKNEESLRKAAPVQRKKLTRDAENSRSSTVTGLRKVKDKSPFKKKKKKATQQASFDSDGENRVPQLFEVGELDSVSSTSLELDVPQESSKQKTSKEQQTSCTSFQVPTSEKAAQTQTFEEVTSTTTNKEIFMDTRISEHIKRRARLNPQPDYCDFAENDLPLRTVNKSVVQCKCCQCCHCPSRPQEQIDRSQHVSKEVIEPPEQSLHTFPEYSKETLSRPPQQSIHTFPEYSKETLSRPPQQSLHTFPEYSTDTLSRPPQQQSDETVTRPPQKSTETVFRPQQFPRTQQSSQETVPRTQLSSKETVPRTQLSSKETVFRPQQLSKDIIYEEPSSHTILTNKRAVPGSLTTQNRPSRASEQKPPKPKTKGSATKKDEVPPKPKITLKSLKDRVPYFGGEPPKPVQFYDHPNRYSKQYLPKTSHIELIDDENLIVSPNLSEDGIREKMRQRDIEAHIRGQVALEKERLQREYRELLKKLPVLQKQERIFEIGTDKEKYHMSKDRLDDLEKKRQNRLDNAYEELFVRRKPISVTLPKRREEEEAPSLNLAAWDGDFALGDERFDTETSKSRTEQLSHLLSNLKSQKNSLLKELESTLSKETLAQLAKSSYDDIKSKSTDYTIGKTKRKRSRDERAISPSTSDMNVEEDTGRRTKSSRGKETISTATTGSPSPRKKAKLKSKKKVLVLQNTSTQTTPKPGQSASTSPLVNTPASEKIESVCPCLKLPEDELCEILIKIKEDEKPEVIVNPPTLSKTVKIVTEEKQVEQKPSGDSRDDRKIITSKNSSVKKPARVSSWREQLSQTTSSHSTSSTSYLEPPNRGVLKKPGKPMESHDGSRSIKEIDPRLLTYIKKLLSMSRASIDDLAVSASDVSTPSTSIVETPANNPLQQLLNVMRYFNLNAADLQKELSVRSDGSSMRYNTSESLAVTSSSSDGGKSIQFQSCTELDPGTKSNKNEEPSKLEHYADIAASCTKKISSLTAMIEKVRAEKKKILQSPPTSSDGERDISTTSYLGLPGASLEKEKDSTSSSTSQDEVDRDLLQIDYSYAEKLKRLSAEDIAKERKRLESDKPQQSLLIAQKTIVVDDAGGAKKVTAAERTTVTMPKPNEDSEEPSPFFLDIPKLPRLEAPSLDKKKTRPPPSKGLRVLGGPVPHELSTIVEADSQLSTKLESPTKAHKSSSESKSSSVPDILTEVQQKNATNSSDDISEMETMETMLISIGMEWAIPTLKKTREALALTSSSSDSKKDSGEVSLREFLSKISSSSSTDNTSKSALSDSQGMSLIQVDNRRTSTPIQGNRIEEKKGGEPIFPTDSDISSVREHSGGSRDKFYDLNDGSLSKTG